MKVFYFVLLTDPPGWNQQLHSAWKTNDLTSELYWVHGKRLVQLHEHDQGRPNETAAIHHLW